MPDGRLSVVEGPVEHFVERFRDVRLHAGVAGLRLLGDALHEGVRDPQRTRRCIPDVDAVVRAIALPQVVDDSEVVVFGEVVRPRNAAPGEAAQLVVGQAGQESLVLPRPRDQEALRHESRREGDPDAGIVVGGECLASIGRIGIRGAAVAVHVDHAGDAGAQQPRRAQQRREPRRETPSQRERQQPGLEQPIADSLLDGRDAIAVMMGVDHAGHDREAVGAHGRRVGMPAAQCLPVADFDDRFRSRRIPPRHSAPNRHPPPPVTIHRPRISIASLIVRSSLAPRRVTIWAGGRAGNAPVGSHPPRR